MREALISNQLTVNTMQITLVSSGDTVSDVLDRFKTIFSLSTETIEGKKTPSMPSILNVETLIKMYSIRELKKIADFFTATFNITDLDAPKRNSKVSLAGWIAEVLLSVREVAEASGVIGEQVADSSVECPGCGFIHGPFGNTLCAYRDPSPDTDLTSGLIISFGKTLEFLPHKTVTRRTWKDAHAQKFINAFSQNRLVKAFDKDPRYGGKQIGWCRLLCAPYKERLCDMPSEDLLAEGGMCDTIGEFVQQYFDGNPRLEMWVIRFEFITGLVFATETNSTETNSVVAADQVANSSSPEIEVLKPEEKPVYTISIVADGKFSEERVNRLPPYLIDRKGNLLKKFWHRSCDAGYVEIASKYLSNISVDSGLVIKLMTDNLEVSQACICGDPPPFIVDNRGGVYKRDYLKLGLAVRYVQVISEYLSNIAVVAYDS